MFRSLISGLGQGVAAWLGAPTADNLALIITNKTGTGALVFNTSPRFVTDIAPVTNDGASLGTASLQWSDLFLAEGGIISWDGGDVTITQANNVLSFAGATTRYEFDAALAPSTSDIAALGTSVLMWSDIFLASGSVLNFNAGNYTVSHSPGLLTFSAAANFSGAVAITTSSATAFTVGLTGATNSAFIVDASIASQVAGLKIAGAATGGTVAVVTTDSGAATNLTINAKGTGTIGIGSASTGRVTITPVTTITGSLTLSAALTYGGVTLSNAVTGTGKMVLDTSPVLITPALGTPTSGVLTNCTGLPSTSIVDAGTAYTPTVTAQAGTITSYTVTLAKYFVSGKATLVVFDIGITNAGTALGAGIISPPTTPANTFCGSVSGREVNIFGFGLSGMVGSGIGIFLTRSDTNGNPVITGTAWAGTSSYITA